MPIDGKVLITNPDESLVAEVATAAPAAGTPGLVVYDMGGGGGGGAMTVADGADVVEGALADAAITSDAAGTLSGKLRGLVKWAFERMPTSLGQKTMAASLPVVLASDQSAVPISAASLPLPSGAATAANQQTNALTDTQLRASPVVISGAVVTF